MRRDLDPIRTALLAQAGRAVFDHPRDLLEAAQGLAEREPHPDRLVCNLADYRAAGLDRNGPLTWLMVLLPVSLKPWSPTEGPPGPLSGTGYKVALEPEIFDATCPQGEVRVPKEP